MKNRLFLSTAIPYVNADPHIGFALELVQTDFLARYNRAKLGREAVFATTGTDENSLKNVRSAETAGIPVESFVEEKAGIFKTLLEKLNADFNAFIRTREDRHMRGAQKLWQACNPEDFYKKEYEGLYCVGCEMFYTEKEVPDGICPEHKKPLEKIKEENYFFKLSKYEKTIERLIASNELRIVPDARKNEMLAFIKNGLEDFSVSRSNERAGHFGVPVPGDATQTMYVWFDALSNYLNALDYADDGELFSDFWNSADAKRVHVIGKGITRFHAIYWIGMLLSAGLPLPDELFVHGYITAGGEKMSKSLGNVINPFTTVDTYGTDATRYYLLREIPSTDDGDYSDARMEERYAELANRLGNLVSRVSAMANKYFEGKLDRISVNWSEQETHLDNAVDDYNFKAYLDYVFEACDAANEVIDKKAPFKLVKTDEAEAKRVLSEVAEMIRFIGRSLAPALPEASAKILESYKEDGTVAIIPGLFPRRDQ